MKRLHVDRLPALPVADELVLVASHNGEMLARVVSLRGERAMEVRRWINSRGQWDLAKWMPISRFVDRPLDTDPRLARALAAEKEMNNAHC